MKTNQNLIKFDENQSEFKEHYMNISQHLIKFNQNNNQTRKNLLK